MEKKKYSPAQLRTMALTLSVVMLAAVCAIVITLLSGAEKPAPLPVESGMEQIDESKPVGKEPSETEDVFGETEAPVVVPDSDQGEQEQPTIKPLSWTMPIEGAMLSKGHDLTKQVFSQTMNDYRIHRGVDLQTSIGDDVLAAADGMVEQVYYDPFEGYCVRIRHENGYATVYKNLAPELPESISQGASVMLGQVIGSVGESAIIEISDEPHLHFEVYLNDSPIDPLSVIPYNPDSVHFGE